MKLLAWKNGQHSTSIHICWQEQVAPSLDSSTAKLATTSRGNLMASLVMNFNFLLVFKSHIVFLCHETSIVHSMVKNCQQAFHQYLHFLEKLSGPISVMAQPNLPQQTRGTSCWPPWSLSFKFCSWLSKNICPFGHETDGVV